MPDNELKLKGILSGGYGIIPKNLMRHKDLSPYAKLVLAYMLSFTGSGNTCFPSIACICEDLNLSKPSIIKAIKECSNIGFIKKEKLYPNEVLKRNHKYIINLDSESKPDLPSMVNDINLCGKPDLPSRATTFTSINNSINNNSINNNNKKRIASAPLSEPHQYIELARLLYTEHLKHDDKFLSGKDIDYTLNSWAKDIRLLIEKEKRDIETVKEVILWCQEWEGNKGFSWRFNILSGKKLRIQFPVLFGQYLQTTKNQKKQLTHEEIMAKIREVRNAAAKQA